MKIMILYTMTFLSLVFSHCQIPCGIFDDIHRVLEIDEHIKISELWTLKDIYKQILINLNQNS